MKIRTTLLTLALAVLTVSSQASSIIQDIGANSGTIYSGQTGGTTDRVLGYQFEVGSAPLAVTSLGAFDKDRDGMPGEVIVGLWQWDSQTLLASAVVPFGTGGTLDGDFRYTQIASPVTLAANTKYVLGMRRSAVGSTSYVDLLFTPQIAPQVGITIGRMRSTIDSPFDTDIADEMPTEDLGSNSVQPLIVGPNLQFQPVPEPSTLAIAGLGLAALIRRRRSAPKS